MTDLQRELGQFVSDLEVELYNSFLNECHEPIFIAGCPRDYSEILEKIDPIAYRVGFNDYLDSLGEQYDIDFVKSYEDRC